MNGNPMVRWVVISLLVLLVIPLLAMLGMMTFGAGMMGGGMMAQMGGGMMALCALWIVLVAAALISLVVLLARGTGVRSPLPH